MLEEAARAVVESPYLEVVKPTWMWHLGTWFRDDHGGGLVVRLEDIKRILQP